MIKVYAFQVGKLKDGQGFLLNLCDKESFNERKHVPNYEIPTRHAKELYEYLKGHFEPQKVKK
ncbi:hypothetical protein HOBO_21 [Bacillus phage Hobo]|uniref:Uncharacterized protein n=2 Tax=Caeruleovirus BM15 TaxID=1985178 RepID=A0A0S2MUB4_9CAUD|nr:hypothetical protein FD732_gp021 [Bacillus phage BM15]ALO79442.1 hypothetical protein BM10_21 [Bacillus phage BM15]AXQ66802.1 hypothetical protein HOBO_21 [Bacillus phage Hobo]